jgi:hypothetical protein
MKAFLIFLILILTVKQSYASCDWYNYNLMGRKIILDSPVKTSSIEGSEVQTLKPHRIMNVQVQAVDYYLAIKYSLDSKKVKQAPTGSSSRWNALYCMTLDDADFLDSSTSNIYVGFYDELQRDLFYEFLMSEPELKFTRSSNSETTQIDQLQVNINEHSFNEFEFEVALAKYLKNINSSLANKLREAVAKKEIHLEELLTDFTTRAELLDYLYNPKTKAKSKNMAQYFSVVGQYEKPLGDEQALNQYYLSTYAYLIFLKTLVNVKSLINKKEDHNNNLVQ